MWRKNRETAADDRLTFRSSPRKRGPSRRVGKGAGIACQRGRASRAPCPPATAYLASMLMVGTAHESCSFALKVVPAPLPTLQDYKVYSIVKQPVTLGKIAASQTDTGPCFGFGPGDRPHSSSSPPSYRGGWRADKALGLDRQARGWLGLRRAWACNDTPRALRRANAASSAYASISDRAAPGALCPWRVIPEAARGSGLRNHPPAGCRSRSPLSRRLMKTPSTMDRDGLHIE
jgi:hypothetical protein